jgi:tetratricopeptide (TPR) repeat protein
MCTTGNSRLQKCTLHLKLNKNTTETMKKTILVLAAALLTATVAFSQEDGAKLAKSAGKAFATYNMDPSGNSAKLQEARQKIEDAMKTPEAQALPSAWITKGDIYSTIVQSEVTRKSFDPKATLSGDNDALIAFDAYKKAYDIAVKKYEKSDAIKGIISVEPHLINIGVEKYQGAAYEKAYRSFAAAISAKEVLSANNEKSALDDPKTFDEIFYFSGKAASLAKLNKEAMMVFEKMYTKGTDNVDVYQSMYDIKAAENDEAGANKILEEGRKKFPDDPGLLFTEINSYLKAGKLDQLTDRLKQAIKQEPGNVGLYITLGNVYDNLFQGQLKEKNDAKANDYFAQAKDYYNQAIARDPKNADATYSLGALYYNKAAFKTQEMNALPDNDFSAAGLKKQADMRKEVMSFFDEALPYFQKAESLSPNDLNTLIALTEIYARKEDDLSLEFKKRLTKVREGGKNDAPYFKQ